MKTSATLEATRSVQQIQPSIVSRGPWDGISRRLESDALGLSQNRSVVRAHGGFIVVWSDPGKDATFRIFLPAADGADSESEEEENRSEPRGSGETILFADDEPEIRNMVSRLLTSSGYRVILASDGAEAIALYARNQASIQLVITDMMMPYVGGQATIRAIRDMAPTVRIIATSGLLSNERIRETAGYRIDAFLVKPFSPTALLTAIQSTLSDQP